MPVITPEGKRYWMSFSTNPAAARLLEDEIERRGLHLKYVKTLCEMITAGGYDWLEEGYCLLLTASPEQRARAFLEAIKQ